MMQSTPLSIPEISTWLTRLTRQLERGMTPDRRAAMQADLRAASSSRAPLGALMSVALLADCLAVVHLAIEADGVSDAEELDRALPLAELAARKYFQVLDGYESFGEPEPARGDLVAFLNAHRTDQGTYGGAASDRWPGLALCRAVAAEANHPGLLRDHERMLDRVMEAVFAGRATAVEQAARRRLRALFEMTQPSAREDPRAIAFCRPDGPEVFATVTHGSQIHERDPLDVPVIHAEARTVFHRQIEHAISPILHAASHGRTMLVLGGSGSGKTHLMRAFRAHVHGERLGYVGYLQMTAEAGDYARYVLQGLVDSLERPYDAPALSESALMYLSTGLAEHESTIPREELELLRSAELDPDAFSRLVGTLVDRLARTSALAGTDSDLVQALLLLQRRDAAIQRRVVKFLRCDSLTPYEQTLLAGLSPRLQPEDAQRTLEQLASLAFRLHQATLVLLVDQIEDAVQDAEGFRRMQRAIDVLRKLADAVPSAVIVIACLDDVYDALRPRLSNSVVDRLEHAPPPVRLTSQRGRPEIEALLESRLEHLYESFDVQWRAEEPLFPFTAADVDQVTNQRARDCLAHFQRFHQECIAAGGIVSPGETDNAGQPGPSTTALMADLDRAWQDALSSAVPPPDDDGPTLTLIARGIAACAVELGNEATATPRVGERPRLAVKHIAGASDRLIELCNKQAQGGHLGRQIEELARATDAAVTPVALRLGEFVFTPRSAIAAKIGLFLAGQGMTISVSLADLRTISAMESFLLAQRDHPQLQEWRRGQQPISQLPLFRALLAPGSGKPATAGDPSAAPAHVPQPRPPSNTSSVPTAPSGGSSGGMLAGGLRIGVGGTLRAEPVHLEIEQLKKHAAFLGGTGSGKTTLALNVIEQLLTRGVSALLVDRKGDLARYADRRWWETPTGDRDLDARRLALRERIDVALYTPGEVGGRPLGLPVIPVGMASMSSQERDQTAKVAAAGLGAMMQYGKGEKFMRRTAILKTAIELHGSYGDATIEELRSTIGQPDPQLLAQVGNLGRHFGGLAEDLDMLWINNRNLLSCDGELLDVPGLLGRKGGKTRLVIISTAGLTDITVIQFWVSRLLVELGRFVRANPSKNLQAVAFFDEADIYIPATRSPATKEPMFDLLRRARSGGLGVLLASQNPGDFDYGARENVETWLVGRIKEARAIEKMRNLLGNYPNIGPRLAAQDTGSFFLLSSRGARELKADQSIMLTEQLGLQEILGIARAGTS